MYLFYLLCYAQRAMILRNRVLARETVLWHSGIFIAPNKTIAVG